MIQFWAQRLYQTTVTSDVAGLHIEDTVAAFLAGRFTTDGKALASLSLDSTRIGDRAAIAAAIVRLTECDDIHVASCITPGSVAVPIALAYSADNHEDHIERAVHAGYAAGIQLGRALGGVNALASGCWPTLFVAPVMAAVTASVARGATADTLAHAIALSLAASAARIGRPSGTPSGRWYLFADAVTRGTRAAHAASRGFRGDLALLTDPWLAAQTGYSDANLAPIEEGGDADSISGTGFKPFSTARQGANAILAFQQLLVEIGDPRAIERIDVAVPAIHLPLLTRAIVPFDRLSTFSNLSYQLGCAALSPETLYDTDRSHPPADEVLKFAQRVAISGDAELDALLPHAWGARVAVTISGKLLQAEVIESEFDGHAVGLRKQLHQKWQRLLSPSDFALVANMAKEGHQKRSAQRALMQLIR